MKTREGILLLTSALLFIGCSNADTTWRPVDEASSAGWVMNAWGPSQDELFAVGGSPDAGVIQHLEAGAWSTLPVPDGVGLVNWAYGFGADDVMFAARGGVVLHWDGSRLEAMTTPTTEDLWGVWGASPDDVWAVGGAGTPDSHVVVLHFDGTSWALAQLPTLMRDAHALFKVWGTSATDVYAVGHRGLVLHWDGSTWTELFVGASDDLVSIWGTGPDHIVAIGGRSIGVAAFWNGTEWRSELLAPMPGLNGVWMRQDGVAHVAGLDGTLLTLHLPSLELDDESVETYDTLHSIFGVGDRLIAVGGDIGLPAPFEGAVYERDLAPGE